MEWEYKRPLWHKIVNPFYPAPMPKKYYVKASQNTREATATKPKTKYG